MSEEQNRDADDSGGVAGEPPAARAGRGIWLVLLLLALAVIAALAFYSGGLAGRLDALLHPEPPTQQALPAPVASAPEPVADRQVPPARRPEPPRPVAADAISSEEAKALLSAIDGLRGELGRLTGEQRKLREALHEQQRMNLQVRLRWVLDPAARLPQMQLAWEEISLLPGLSDTQRAEAVRMHALARSGVERLRQWRLAIGRLTDTLETPVHADILPRPEHPWLAWIVGQFHLRPAPSGEVRRLSGLRTRLLETARLLELEQWPEAGAWQALRAELILYLKSPERGDVVDPGLPEDFSGIRDDIKTLRDTARNWLERI